MKFNRMVTTTLLAASATTACLAQDGLTRDQVRAEFQAAQRDGLLTQGDSDTRAADLHPDRYPVRQAGATVTRAQVKAELRGAIAAGELMVGDSGRTAAEIDPGRYPMPAPVAGLTRAQVQAETLEAIRRGDVQQGDRGLTLAQINPGNYAAARGETPDRAHRLAMK